jgi:PAS domain S-box-containing protein
MAHLKDISARFSCFTLLLLYLLISLPCSPTAFAAVDDTVRVGIFENKPMCYTDAEGSPAGIFALDKNNAATPSRIVAIDRHLNSLIAEPNSSYHQVISEALGGGVSTKSVIPRQVWWMVTLGCLVLLVLLVVALILRRQIKRKSARLIEANSFNKQIIDCVEEGIIVYDLEGRFQGWNPYMEEISGKSADQVIGMFPSELFPFLEGSETIEQLSRAIQGETFPPLDFPYSIPETGENGWISAQKSPLKDSRGEIIGAISIVREITEERRAAATIKEKEKVLRSLLESTSTVPWELDLKSNNFTYMGQQVESMLGYPVDSWKNMETWAGRICPEDRVGAVEFCTIQTRKAKDHDFVYRATHQDGSVRWIRDIITVVKEAGKAVRLVGFLHDITDEKLLSLEKVDLERRLQQAQKMEAIGTLAGGIAHDFNNILGAVLGYTELAQDAVEKGSVVAADLDKVIESGNRAKDLVKQILAFSRQGDVERVALQPVLVVKEVLKMLRPSLPSTIEIRQNMSSDTGLIYADPTQIHQIVMNLCTNAFQAMEVLGGKLEVSVGEVMLGSADLVHEPDVVPGEFVQISVADSGPGIDVLLQEKIFDPYFTTKETGKGTGMGLSIVHGIVKSYGGVITLESGQGEGTVFHVYFPVVEQDELPVKIEENGASAGSERILFVDDEPLLAEMGRDMLERLGYHVTMHTSSLDALETFQNQPNEFDLVITDQTMPGMTGVDLARRLMQIRLDIPVILCTGYSAIITEKQAKSMGIAEFAFKPVSQKALVSLIRKVLDA